MEQVLVEPWLTYTEAVRLTHRSKRTLQRWVAAGQVDTIEDADGTTLLRTTDVNRVEKAKTDYLRRPGRHAA